MAQGTGEIGRARQCIAALQTLSDIDGEPTAQQLQALTQWHGWGPLAKALDLRPRDPVWQDLAGQLRVLLPKDQRDAGRNATDTAFYTPADVAGAVWDIVTGLGYPGGTRALEPGCGSGNFMRATPATLMPVAWVGVEADETSARIAGLLNPDATIIHSRIEKTAIARGSAGVAVGNVPFSPAGPFDPSAPPGLNLHNYCIWRSLEAVAPGGIVAVLTSRYTLDAEHPQQRRALAELGRLIGAIRLPSVALEPGGTRAVADIVVFRRLFPGEPWGEQEWLERSERLFETTVSRYFLAHPEMVLGEMAPKGAAQHGQTLDVIAPEDADPAAMLAAAGRRLVAHGREQGLAYAAQVTSRAPVTLNPAAAREGSYVLHKRPKGKPPKVTQIRDGREQPVRAGGELVSLIRLRDAALALFAAETDRDMDDGVRAGIRKRALRLYQGYTAKYGYLNRCHLSEGKPDEDGQPSIVRRRPSMGGFRSDPDYVTVLAIEVWDDDAEAGKPAPILLRHVNAAAERKAHTDDASEALALCLDETGRVDFDVIHRLTGAPKMALPRMLAGQVYADPADLRWVTADEYLSGNVRRKLAEARDAAKLDPARWAGNVAALEKVQPRDLEPGEINVQLGSPWIPPEDIAVFVVSLLGGRPDSLRRGRPDVTVRYEPLTATWEVRATTELRAKPAARAEWGTPRKNPVDLIEAALNNRTVTVYDTVTVGDSERNVRNEEETQLAAERIRDLQERFASWVWEWPEMASRLAAIYNERYNSIRVREYNGAHLTFPGLAGWFTPYPSQRDMVWQNVCTPAALCGHTVGGGKTFIAVASAMTMQRLGLARKPLIVVPNHLLEQIAAEARRLYPAARILMVTREDLTPQRRRGFLAKIAAAEWDLIVATVEQFGSIPTSEAEQAAYIGEQIEEFEAAVRADGLEETGMAKRLAKQIRRLVAQHERLLHARRDDGALTFEQLGIDVLFLDEAHAYKRLRMACRAEGLTSEGSKRSEDLQMKLSWLRRRNPDGRSGYMFTGTPLTNSLSEMYVWLRYLTPGRLAELGIASLDAFAAQFVRYSTQTEVAPDGSGFRQYRRPRLYVNLPELRQIFGSVASIRTRSDLNLPGPKVRQRHVAVPGSPELAAITSELVERSDAIRRGGVDPRQDNMFLVCSDGRRAALDTRLLGVEPSKPGKVDAVVAEAARRYRMYRHNAYPEPGNGMFHPRLGALQGIFCDQGTPSESKGSQVYGRIKAGLIAAGVPRDVIAFAHDAKTSGDTADLHRRCRDGRVQILLTSTAKGGTGLNVQPRLIAIHHVDAPWMPGDLEQRNGRGDRPGNANNELEIITYLTEGSFDSYMWQAIERKALWISQILTGDPSVRVIEEAPDPRVLTYAEFKAVATGQPLLRMLSEANAEVSRLWTLRSGWQRAQAQLQADLQQRMAWANIAKYQAEVLQEIAVISQDADRYLLHHQAPIPGVVTEAEAAETLAAKARECRENGYTSGTYAAEWRDVAVWFEVEWVRGSRGGQRAVLTVGLSGQAGAGEVRFQVRGNVWGPGGGQLIIEQIDEYLAGAAALAAERAQDETRHRAEIEEIRPRLGGEFEHAEALRAAIRHRGEIERQIDEAAGVRHAETSVPAAA